MQINFQYKTEKGIHDINCDIEPITIRDNGEEIAWFVEFKKKFGFSKKIFLEILEHWVSIRFSRHTTQSYTIWGTINAIPANFFYPVTNGEPKPKSRYLCALSETGVEVIQILDSLLQIEDDYEEFAEQWFKDYITFVKETK